MLYFSMHVAVNWCWSSLNFSEPEIDVSEIEILFSATVAKPATKSGGQKKSAPKSEIIHLVNIEKD